MHGAIREALGFLCRWCLLALVGLIVPCLTWAALLATATPAAHARREVVAPDSIRQRPRDRYLVAYPDPHVRRASSTVLIVNRPDEGVCGLYSGRDHVFYIPLGKTRLGISRVLLNGVPYGPHAFCREETLLQIVSPGRRVFLIDAGAAFDLPADAERVFKDCLEKLRRRGAAVFFHPGALPDYVRVRRRLRGPYPGTPVVYRVTRKPDPMDALAYAAKTLCRRRKENCVVITPDANLARRAAESGFAAHLLASDEIQEGRPGRLLRHNSLAKFKEYLAREPIR